MKKLLSGSWLFDTDLNNMGIKNQIYLNKNIINNKDNYEKITVPSCWNSDPNLDRYEGICWYFKSFKINEFDKETSEFFIVFEGINYYSKIWLNGNFIGSHKGGFLPFRLKIDTKNISLNKINYLAVRVDNIRRKDAIPGKLFDWYNWGGIYRDVFYEILPKDRIKWMHIISSLQKNQANLKIIYRLTSVEPFSYNIKLKENIIKEGDIKPISDNGYFLIKIKNPKLWSPNHPALYHIEINLTNNKHYLREMFGIRAIKTKDSRLYLNNKQIKLYGVNLHEELIPFGRAIPIEERKKDLKNIKKLGFNAIRSAHYSHDESLLDLADELGILILEEIPVYWNIRYKNRETLKFAAQMIHDLIFRDYNHPSVIFWSVGNEIPIESIHCHRFILSLIRYAKKLDPYRLVSYVSSHFLSDHYRRKTDIAILNEYFGWYFLSVKNLNFILEMTRGISLCYNKPWFITEFGAGAKKGFHSNTLKKFSEEKQASIISRSIEIFNSKDWIAGWFIWIYRDFKSALRTNQYQNGFNRKGIVSEKNEAKLIAKIMPKIIKKSTPTRKFSFLSKLAFPLGFFFSYVFKIMDLANILQEKMMNKFYSKKKK
ncbi:MAG: hypothetical protein EU548_07415 [Promethearchaeota archaeon]|nr:MAG: hypothetical protein EU548_07415 [Candidatus Lokiarchaeota archaeon]